MSIFGNHSATQYPDIFNAEVDGKNAAQLVNDQDWVEKTFIPTVQKRGAAIIEARGLSSAASAANAAIDHVRDWVGGSASGDWLSMGVPSDGSYGIPEGVMFGYPVTTSGGRYEIVKGLQHNDFAKGKIAATHKELLEERAAIEHLLKG
jgi:malate dehydrogenase